jgi:hypothetical protein
MNPESKLRRTNHKEVVCMRRKALASILAVAALSISAAPAFADPDFGPGNSSKGPHDGGAKCHPPGQTADEPGCR